jgi:nitrite reductase/ring-hydroxylating ferredoxin subunit
MKKIYLCSLEELSKNKSIIKWVDEIKDEVVVFHDKENKLKVFSSICPHFGGELIYDNIEKNLRCKWHGWKFETSNGTCINNSVRTRAKQIEFKIDPDPITNYKNDVFNKLIYLIL